MEYISEMWRLALAGETRGIFFWAAIYFLVAATYSLVYQLKIRRWPSVRGELHESGVRRFGGQALVAADQENVARAVYSYRVGQTEYQGHRVSPWVVVASHNAKGILRRQLDSVNQQEDGGVEVYSNPRKPGKSFLVKSGWIGIGVTLCLGLVPIGYYALKYHI